MARLSDMVIAAGHRNARYFGRCELKLGPYGSKEQHRIGYAYLHAPAARVGAHWVGFQRFLAELKAGSEEHHQGVARPLHLC